MNPLYWLGYCFFREVSRGFYGMKVIGGEHIKFDGPALIASNHVSYLDPPFVGSCFDEDLYFSARKTLFGSAFTQWLLARWQAIPVDRDKPDASSIKAIFKRLKEGKKIIIFPKAPQPDGNLLPGEPGVGMIIARANVPVIPVRILGAHLALPRDRKFPQPAHITVCFGKPWTYKPEDFPQTDRGELYQRISDEVMRRIGDLKE